MQRSTRCEPRHCCGGGDTAALRSGALHFQYSTLQLMACAPSSPVWSTMRSGASGSNIVVVWCLIPKAHHMLIVLPRSCGCCFRSVSPSRSRELRLRRCLGRVIRGHHCQCPAVKSSPWRAAQQSPDYRNAFSHVEPPRDTKGGLRTPLHLVNSSYSTSTPRPAVAPRINSHLGPGNELRISHRTLPTCSREAPHRAADSHRFT